MPFRRFSEGPGQDSGGRSASSFAPSAASCIAASAVVAACGQPSILYEDLHPGMPAPTPRAKPKRKRVQSAKQKKHTAAFGKRMAKCGKAWAAKTDAARAKTDYRTFQAKFCKK